ncbi:MAG: hypothetical protein NT126_04355 [Bacteroidetes bacterium]|nr:hypothetical protein [Bacteroidota bacterium]
MTFSIEEMEVLENSRFFVIKQEATKKIVRLFGELENRLTAKMKPYSYPAEMKLNLAEKGKIFRGENYHNLPYIILDCPREFHAESIFAFRSMFWWGHEFSFTLHLQGKALDASREKIERGISSLLNHDFFICVNTTPWEYSFEESNYRSLDDWHAQHSGKVKMKIRTGDFLKLSRKLKPDQYDQCIPFGIETFELLMALLD